MIRLMRITSIEGRGAAPAAARKTGRTAVDTESATLFRPVDSLQQLLASVPLDLIEHKTHELLRQIAVNVFAGSGGPNVRSGPRELIKFSGDDPGPFGIQFET